jgi:hypothetical protein
MLTASQATVAAFLNPLDQVGEDEDEAKVEYCSYC